MSRYSVEIAARVIKALESGQKHKRMLCEALDCVYQTIDPTVAEMRRREEIIVLGTASEAGYTGVQRHAPVYGLPGTTLRIVQMVATPRKGSGVIAGKIVIGGGFRWNGPW